MGQLGNAALKAAIASAIKVLASLVLGSKTFNSIVGAVERWADKKIANAEKRHGVLAELEIIGLKLTESSARLGVELAVKFLKNQAGK